MNSCVFVGNFVRDPEVQQVGAEHRVAKFAIAVNNGRKNRNGEEEVAFIECEAWDKSADTISKYMKKGSKIAVQVTARTETWTDKSTGAKRSALKFRVNNFTFLGTKAGESRPDKQVGAETVVGNEEAGYSDVEQDQDEDIPF